MKGIDLLQKHPNAANLIKKWFVTSMINSANDSDVPDDFKNYIIEQGVDDDKIAILIDANPRMLFDVFDENKIYINITRSADKFIFSWCDGEEYYTKDASFDSRKECEMTSIEIAFGILERNLNMLKEEND